MGPSQGFGGERTHWRLIKLTFGDKRRIDESPKPTKVERRSEKKKHKSTRAKINGRELRGQMHFASAANKMKGHQNGNPKCGFRVCEWDEG